MGVVTIVVDDGGVVEVRREDFGTLKRGYQIFKTVNEIRKILKGSDLDPLAADRNANTKLFYSDLIDKSDRLTPEEKQKYKDALYGGPLAVDKLVVEENPTRWAELHPVADAPGPITYPPITRVVDP